MCNNDVIQKLTVLARKKKWFLGNNMIFEQTLVVGKQRFFFQKIKCGARIRAGWWIVKKIYDYNHFSFLSASTHCHFLVTYCCLGALTLHTHTHTGRQQCSFTAGPSQ